MVIGNRTSLRKRDGSTLTYTYHALNRMTRKTVPERAGLDPAHTRDVFYGYNVLDLQATPAGENGDSMGFRAEKIRPAPDPQ